MTRAEVGQSTDWATQAPLDQKFFVCYKEHWWDTRWDLNKICRLGNTVNTQSVLILLYFCNKMSLLLGNMHWAFRGKGTPCLQLTLKWFSGGREGVCVCLHVRVSRERRANMWQGANVQGIRVKGRHDFFALFLQLFCMSDMISK